MEHSRNSELAAGLRVCKKCMIPDYIEDKDAFLETYIQGIPEEERTEASEYERRLQICDACEHLLNGMCRRCGCFVAVRGAAARNYCPDPKKKW